MRKLYFLLSSLIVISSVFYYTNNPLKDDPSPTIPIIEENTQPEVPAASNIDNNLQPNALPDQDSNQQPPVTTVSEIRDLIMEAYNSQKAKLECKVSKNMVNNETISQIIKEVNTNSATSNFFISEYKYETKGYQYENALTLTLSFEYKQVIDGYTEDNVVMVSSYQDLEQAVIDGISSTSEKINYKITNQNLDYSVENLLAVIEKTADKNRGNYVDSYGVNSFGQGGYITLKYYYPVERVREIKDEVNSKAREIVSSVITPNMSELEKEKALHDYIVLNTRYDKDNFEKNTVPKESYTAYGVFFKGVAVCEGYAGAMDILLKLAGIESKIITGTANNGSYNGPHAWNLVKVNGSWYHLDTTWNDPVPDQPGQVKHKFFNLTEDEIRKTHSF